MDNNIVRIGLFTKKENLTIDQFRDYWHYHHAAIASNMHGMMRYDQNHVVRKVDLGLAPGNSRECNGMSQIWFGSMQSQKSNDPETMNKLAVDERILFGSMDLVVCNAKVYKTMTPDTPYIKYMCFVKRKPELSENDFNAELAKIAGAVMAMPDLIEYRENIVVERLMDNVQGNRAKQPDVQEGHAHPSWISADYNDVPVDAVLEMYFKFSEQTAINNIFDTEEGKAVCSLTNNVMSEAACFLCDVHHIVNKF